MLYKNPRAVNLAETSTVNMPVWSGERNRTIMVLLFFFVLLRSMGNDNQSTLRTDFLFSVT